MNRNSDGQTVDIHESAPGRFGVRGALTFNTARRARDLGVRAFGKTNGSAIEVDLSGVQASDSAGLAVLLDWLAWAHRAGRKLAYKGLPEDLKAIARISEVEPLVNGDASLAREKAAG